jgi:hypothetical protein
MDTLPILPVSFEEAPQAWRAAEDEARLAYRAWCEAKAHERRAAYAVFLAADDRAAAAAEALGRCQRR